MEHLRRHCALPLPGHLARYQRGWQHNPNHLRHHRFAIGAHRQKRAKAFTGSSLDEVPGIGPARKRALLMHFGTAKAVRNAALDDLLKVPGVSRAMAQSIYDYFHGD